MRVLLSGGKKTCNIIDGIRKKFTTSGDDFVVIEYLDDIINMFSRGDYFDKAVIIEQSITRDGAITDEMQIRQRVNQFSMDIVKKVRKGNYVFLSQNQSIAEMIYDEILPIANDSAVVCMAPPYKATFFADLIVKEAAELPREWIYEPELAVPDIEDFDFNEDEEDKIDTSGMDLSLDLPEVPADDIFGGDVFSSDNSSGGVGTGFDIEQGFGSDNFGIPDDLEGMLSEENFGDTGVNFDNDNGFGENFGGGFDGGFEEGSGFDEGFDSEVNFNGEVPNDFGNNGFDDGFQVSDDGFENTQDNWQTESVVNGTGLSFTKDEAIESDVMEPIKQSSDLPNYMENNGTGFGDFDDSTNVQENEFEEFNNAEYTQQNTEFGVDGYSQGFDNGDYEQQNEGFDNDMYGQQNQGFGIDDYSQGFDNDMYEQQNQGFDDGMYEQQNSGFDAGMYSQQAQGFDDGMYGQQNSGFDDRMYSQQAQGFDNDVYNNNQSNGYMDDDMYSNSQSNDNGMQGFGEDIYGNDQQDEYQSNVESNMYGNPSGFDQQSYNQAAMMAAAAAGATAVAAGNLHNQIPQQTMQVQKPKGLKGLFGKKQNNQAQYQEMAGQLNTAQSVQAWQQQNNQAMVNMGNGNNTVDINSIKHQLKPFASRGNSIVVTGCGGCGTSTVAYSLANIINQLGYTVLLVDMDTEGRAQSYISKLNYDSMEPDGANLMSAVNSSNGITTQEAIVKQGFHLLTMGLGTDTAPVNELLHKEKISRFVNLAKTSHNFVIYDVPFDSATGFLSEITYMADNLVLVTDASNWGITKMMLSVCNIGLDDMQDTIFSRAQLVFNRYRNLTKLLGKKVRTGVDITKVVDMKVYELIGEDPGFHFEDLHIAGIINDDPEIENGWFDNRHYSDSPKGQAIFLEILEHIVLKR